MANKPPHLGGCWYCHDDQEPMLFSTEFDCYVHQTCLANAAKVPNDREAAIMAKELLPNLTGTVTRLGMLILLRDLLRDASISHTDPDDHSGCNTRYYVDQEQLLRNIEAEILKQST
jgi:hypothetical protein